MKNRVITYTSFALAICVTLVACSRFEVAYAGATQSARMFTQICSAALKTEANGRKAYSRLGFEPREHSANSFVHPEISAFGHFFYSEGGPVKRRDGKVVAFAKPSRKCEMEFTLPILEGCSSGHTEQDREVAEFKKVLGKTLGPERDLSDLNSRGVYIRGTGGGKRCIKRISATVWSD